MNVRYRVELNHAEQEALTALVSGGKHPVRRLKRAQILLAAHAAVGDEAIARAIGTSGSTVYRTKRRFVEESLEAALSEEPRLGPERKLTGREEALLVATACSAPPPGCARWTLELLFVRLTEHESLSRETVRRRLAENHLKPWRKDMWCIPKVDAEYVARMEDVLDLYAEEPDPSRPVVCFDERSTTTTFPKLADLKTLLTPPAVGAYSRSCRSCSLAEKSIERRWPTSPPRRAPTRPYVPPASGSDEQVGRHPGIYLRSEQWPLTTARDVNVRSRVGCWGR
jgi:transposase